MKNIYHITENISNESGGVRTIIKLLHEYLKKQKFNSNIVTNKKELTDDYIEFKSNKLWYYNRNLMSYLSKTDTVDNIFHLHGVYTYSQYIACKISTGKNIPYVVSPHGMLEPWILNKNPFKKKLYLQLILNNILNKSSVLHAITPLEKDNLYNLTKHKNIIEIPNLFDFKSVPNNLTYQPKEDYLIYIGRIDKKKGIELIINVLSKIKNKDIRLKILGTENEYSSYLKSKVNDLNLNDRVDFLGAIFNDEKYNLIANSRSLISPSYSEAIGMVNLEGAACKTPVITTHQTGLNNGWNNNGGKLINPLESELHDAINECLSWSIQERIERGDSLYDFAQKNYGWDKKGHLWDELYSSL